MRPPNLLSSPANAARLAEAFNDWRSGRNIQEREDDTLVILPCRFHY